MQARKQFEKATNEAGAAKNADKELSNTEGA
jgi:hypothetical protein